MNRKKILYLTELAVLVAIVILMTFTPLGYFKTIGVEITFLMIPVVIGAIVMGPMAGGILGGVFGATSFMQCFGPNVFGATLLSINPVFTVILCLVPRILLGVLAGYIFKVFKKKSILAFLVASLSGALINTLLFVGGIILFFGSSEYIQGLIQALGSGNVLVFFAAFVGINGLIEAGTCGLIGTAVSKAIYVFNSKSLK